MLTPEEISYILPDIVLPKENEFDDILIETLKPYFGRTVDSLKKEFHNYRSGYSEKNDIIKQIFKSENDLDETDEFQKANYKLRTLTVDKKGTPTQDMSLSAFDFDGLLKEKNWTESIVYDEMVDSKFLLVVFSKNAEGQEILNNAFIWYLPKKDVNKVKDVWKEARKVIKGGIKLQQKLSHDRNGRLIFVYENIHSAKMYNENVIKIDEMFEFIFKEKYISIATDIDNWNKIKQEFNNKQKKYEYIEEPKELLEKLQQNNSENNIEKTFGNIIEYS